MMQVDGLRAGDTLNVRAGAGASFPDIGDLQSGEIINVLGLDDSGKWAAIIYRGQSGYVSLQYLRDITRPDGSSTSTGTYWVSGIEPNDPDGGLVVRAGSGRNFDAIGVLTDGTKVHVIQRSGDGSWAMIAFGSDVGWVSAAYLTGAATQPDPLTALQT